MATAITITPSELTKEWLRVQGRDVLREMVYGFESAPYLTPYAGVTDTLSIAQMRVLKKLITEWNGTKTKTDDAFELSAMKLSVTQFETAMEFQFDSETMRSFNSYLKGANKTTDDMHVLDYLMDPIAEQRLNEMEDGVWQAVEQSAVPGQKREFAERFNGYVKIAKLAGAAGKASVVATGASNNTNANDKVNMVYKAANKNLKKKGMLIFCSYGFAEIYCENRFKDANVESKMLTVGQTGYTGIPLTLGGGKSFLVPLAGFPDGDGLMASFKEALAYGFEYESRVNNWRVQEDGWDTWVANAFDFGVQILVQRPGYLLINDRL